MTVEQNSASIIDVLRQFGKDNLDLVFQNVEKYVAIKGTKRELEFLAALLLAHAYNDNDDAKVLVLDPDNQSQYFINKNESNIGLCIYRD